MAQRRKRRAVAKPSKKRRWLLIPKLLLLLACVGLVLFIGAIFVMEAELRRIGLFGPEGMNEPTQSEMVPADAVGAGHNAATVAEEVTQDERRQLEAILQKQSEDGV
mgnify:CR=1 FL=1